MIFRLMGRVCINRNNDCDQYVTNIFEPFDVSVQQVKDDTGGDDVAAFRNTKAYVENPKP